ncbi:MAG TPA: hypothetical protein VF586_11355 [Pyrinomonadaceae bacterium]|jgi:hypothetical protein
MNWSKFHAALAFLALGNAGYGLLRLLGVGPASPWVLASLAASLLVALAPLLRRRVVSSRWPYRLYRARRNPRLAGAFHLPPRPGLLERRYLRVRPPRWCGADDLSAAFRDRGKLLREGNIVPAVLVQANTALFEPGADDAPANVIYSTDAEAEQPVARMLEVARGIFSLKGTRPEDPDEARFARMVSYELGRDFRVTVPERLSGGLDLTYTTIMVHRRHLPEGRLAAPYFPLLIHPESRASMILPARYWPDDFLAEWVRIGDAG